MNLVLGFSGKKQSGKSTACQIIRSYNQNMIEVSLASKLKETCARVFDIELKSFDCNIRKEMELCDPIVLKSYHILNILESYFDSYQISQDFLNKHEGKILISRRHILQYVGTEILRSIDNEVHTKALWKKMQMSPEAIFVISDIRFPNEYSFFKDKLGDKFQCYYVKRNEAESKVDGHSSETSMNETALLCEHTLENNGTLAEYKKTISKTFKDLINLRSEDRIS